MSRSNDAGHFFQTTASLEDAARKELKKKNKLGNPIKLPSKILAVLADSSDSGLVYVAEAAGVVKQINVDSGTVTKTLRPATAALAPLTCLTTDGNLLYAGSWDKNIYAWDLSESGDAKSITTFTGHTDFVKALASFKVSDDSLILVSGSADATINVWDASTGAKLHTLKGHTRGVQALVLESIASESATVFSGDSSKEIRRWSISPRKSFEIPTTDPSAEETTAGPIDPLLSHETSIYALAFDADTDLWTASADKTAKCLSRASKKWTADTTLQHPDFVRCIAIHEGLGLVVTGCRDEIVRIWDKGTGKLVITLEGHYEEVTGVVVDEAKRRAITVSIDGTVRTWGLTQADIGKAREEMEKWNKGDVEEETKKCSMLTAEEEAELAELMDDDD